MHLPRLHQFPSAVKCDAEHAPPNIGGPIANTGLYVLGSEGELKPIGVAGELCIAGPSLARGYHERPEQTAERFVPNPYGAPGTRLYRTGDFARWRRDGTLEYLGRRDEQVKLRGYRIELGEIQNALQSEPTVSQAAVVVRGEGGQAQLVAYCVGSEGGGGIDAKQLKAALLRKLPEYMVPVMWVELEELPLGPNGKVDKKRLPAPEAQGERRNPERALTPTESVVLGEMRNVLGTQALDVDDSFFELGGHSLLATQLVGRLNEHFSLELPLRTIFDASSAAELARVVEERRAAGEIVIERIERVSRSGPLPLSYGQQQL